MFDRYPDRSSKSEAFFGTQQPFSSGPKGAVLRRPMNRISPESPMINVGVIGLGMMGLTHLDVYAAAAGARVVAIADADPDRRSGKVKASGNVEGQAKGGFDVASVKGYADGMELIR